MRIPSGKTDQKIFFIAVDSTDLKTRKTALTTFTVYRSRNGGTATVYTTPTVAELDATNMPGVYSLLIDEDTTIASTSDSEEYCVHITQASMAPVTRTVELYRRDTTSGNTAAVDANGRVDVIKIAGTTQTARDIGASVLLSSGTGTGQLDFTSGVVKANATQINGVATTSVTTVNANIGMTQPINFTGTGVSALVKSDTVDIAGAAVSTSSAQIGVNVVNAGATAWNSGAITTGTFAAGAINAAAIATDAIGAAELAADAVVEIRSLASGTSDSGTTTTMVDAARTEADTDYWAGQYIVFTSGNIAGQARLITGFNAATDTITFTPATTQAVTTQTYEIWPGGRVDLGTILGTAVSTPATAGILDVNVKNIGNNAVSSSGTITFPAATLASTTNITAGTITTATNVTTVNGLAANVITAASINTAAITSAKFAAGAIDAAALAADAGAEIAAAVWDLDATAHQTQGTFGQAIGDPGADTDSIWALANTNLDATVSSRLATAGYTAPPTAAQNATAVLTTQMTESYAALGAAPTLAQAEFEIRALLAEKAVSGTTLTAKKVDGTTTAATYTLNDATTPTVITRAS